MLHPVVDDRVHIFSFLVANQRFHTAKAANKGIQKIGYWLGTLVWNGYCLRPLGAIYICYCLIFSEGGRSYQPRLRSCPGTGILWSGWVFLLIWGLVTKHFRQALTSSNNGPRFRLSFHLCPNSHQKLGFRDRPSGHLAFGSPSHGKESLHLLNIAQLFVWT